MYRFIGGCQNPSEISFEKFLAQRSVLSVLSPDNAVDAPRNLQGQIDEKSVLEKSSVLQSSVSFQTSPCGEDRRGTGKIDRPTPARKGPKIRSLEMEIFKGILSKLKEPFSYTRLCNICDSVGLPPSKYKTWIQEEEQNGRIIKNNGNYEVVKEASS